MGFKFIHTDGGFAGQKSPVVLTWGAQHLMPERYTLVGGAVLDFAGWAENNNRRGLDGIGNVHRAAVIADYKVGLV